MQRDFYKNTFTKIRPSVQIIDKTREMIEGKSKKKKYPYRHLKRGIAVAATFVIVLASALPILAANVPIAYDVLYMVSPATAQYFKPVKKSCIQNGIKLEVESSRIMGDTAQIYVTLQDLEGDRVDETTDLYDSYSIRLPYGSSSNCRMVKFDKTDKKAYFMITIINFYGQNIQGKKITFSLKCFLSGKKVYENIKIPISWAAVPENAPTQEKTQVQSLHGSSREEYFKKTKMLLPSGNIKSPVDGVEITAIGYIDGKLHVQTVVRNYLKSGNMIFLKLVDAGGRQKTHSDLLSYHEQVGDEESENWDSYEEYVFDVPKNKIANYRLVGDYNIYKNYVEGNWQVTYPIG